MTEWQCTSAGRIDHRGLVERVRSSWPILRLWTVREFRSRYRQHALDVLWSLVTPVVIFVIYGLVLTSAFDVDGEGIPYLAFAWAGLVPWTFVSSSVLAAVPSISYAADTISKVWFPREIIPLAEVGVACVELGIMTLILLGIAVVQGPGLGLTVIAVPVVLLMILLWAAALSVLGATVGVFVRDLRPAAALLTRVGFIASPIMYPPSLVPDALQWTVDANPVAVAAESLRDVLFRETWPDWPLLVGQCGVSAVLLIGAIAYTRALEPRMVDLV